MKNSIPFINLNFFLNKNCNAKCIFCDTWQNDLEDSISFEYWIEMVKSFKDFTEIKSVNLDGGEPFFYKDIFKLLKGLKSLGINPNLTTNGSLLNSDNCKTSVDSGIKQICNKRNHGLS